MHQNVNPSAKNLPARGELGGEERRVVEEPARTAE